MSQVVVNQVVQLLTDANIAFRQVEHEETLTSEDSALARNEPLEVGAKALLLKSDQEFVLAVIPAHRKLNSAAIKKLLNVKNLRFATAEELLEQTGLLPGSVPPFGSPIFTFRLFADHSVGQEWGRIAFNSGSRTRSIIMQRDDWLAIAKPVLANLCS